jgi:Tfp pilus assembly protein PilP
MKISHRICCGTVVWLPFVFGVLGCSKYSDANLEEYLAGVKSAPVKDISPLPDFVPIEVDPDRLVIHRDPFAPLTGRGTPTPAQSAVGTPLPGGALAQVAMSSIRLVRTQHHDGQPVAIVATANDDLYRVIVGDRLGANATIVGIANDEITVRSQGRTIAMRASSAAR